MKDFLILFVQLSLALVVAEFGKDAIKVIFRVFYDKVILWAWAVVR